MFLLALGGIAVGVASVEQLRAAKLNWGSSEADGFCRGATPQQRPSNPEWQHFSALPVPAVNLALHPVALSA